jgi:hypothetical protein
MAQSGSSRAASRNARNASKSQEQCNRERPWSNQTRAFGEEVVIAKWLFATPGIKEQTAKLFVTQGHEGIYQSRTVSRQQRGN